MIQNEQRVYLEKRDCFAYPRYDYLYSPHVLYPEYPFSGDTISGYKNEVYDMVRASLIGLGLDKEKIGSKKWNPLGDYVKPGSHILIKPNWVMHRNPVDSLDCMVTHLSVIRCIIDYCVIARADIIELADSPQQECDFDRLLTSYKYIEVLDFYKKQGVNVFITDFRVTNLKKIGFFLKEQSKDANKTKLIEFDLKKKSFFNNLFGQFRYRIATYHDDRLNSFHNQENNKYGIAESVFKADLIINIPKPKTHRFSGITGAQKNFIGICPDKEYLPHYRTGNPTNGGDEMNKSSNTAQLNSWINYQVNKHIAEGNVILQFFFKYIGALIFRVEKYFSLDDQKIFTKGIWYGNDTIWRTILDINLLLFYGNLDGSINLDGNKRKVLSIGDMIIAGEKNGPLRPSAKPLGIILASNNCALFDYVFCKITGFDHKLIPSVANAISNSLLLKRSIENIRLLSNLENLNNIPVQDVVFPKEWNFVPNPYWRDILLKQE
jgi:uncharacterized protein (DUF362 family)